MDNIIDSVKSALGFKSENMTNRAVAVLKGEVVNGVVWFTQNKEGEETTVSGEVKNLDPGLHGFHIHQYGDSTNGCISAGPHFNPFGMTHGGPNDVNRHVGDLGNVEADSKGVAKFEFKDKLIQLHGANSIVGRSLVIHAGTDDLGKGDADKKEESLKTGNAGPRSACGVVGWAASS